MIGRSELEFALQAAIKGNKKSAIPLIILVQEDTGLNSIDEITKRSFLHDALEVGFREVVDLLLEKMDKKTLFCRDAQGQTCLFLAAKCGYADIVKYFIDQSSQTSGHEVWLAKDNKGNSPLHMAVHNEHVGVVLELLSQIAKGPNAFNNINNTNEDGQMPLHLACIRKNLNMPLVTKLIQYGADLDVNNSHDKTALALIANFDFDNEQLKLFEGLGDRQKKFLLSYFKYQQANPNNEKLTLNYQKLLQFYNISIYQTSRKDFMTRTGNQVLEIPDFLTELPTPEMFDIFFEENKNQENSHAYQCIKKDDDMLKKIREFIQIFLQDLNDRPKQVNSYRNVLMMVGISVFYMAMEIWLVKSLQKFNGLYSQAEKDNDSTKVIEYRGSQQSYQTAAMLFGCLGGIFLCAFVIPLITTYKKMPAYVYHNEWDDLINYIHENLLDFLIDLRIKSIADNCDYLPITDERLKNFELNMAEFKSDKKKVIELIDMTVRLDDNVETVRKGVLANSKPFSMFYKKPQHTVIDMSQKDSSNNEAMPLKFRIN